jgi:hypothetical protein
VILEGNGSAVDNGDRNTAIGANGELNADWNGDVDDGVTSDGDEAGMGASGRLANRTFSDRVRDFKEGICVPLGPLLAPRFAPEAKDGDATASTEAASAITTAAAHPVSSPPKAGLSDATSSTARKLTPHVSKSIVSGYASEHDETGAKNALSFGLVASLAENKW